MTDRIIAYDDLEEDIDPRLTPLIRDIEVLYPHVNAPAELAGSLMLSGTDVATASAGATSAEPPRTTGVPRRAVAAWGRARLWGTAISVPAVVAITAVVAIILSNSGGVTPPALVSAQTVIRRAIRATMPRPGYQMRADYGVKLRCPLNLRCPHARGSRWVTNLQGVYIGDTRFHVDVPGVPMGFTVNGDQGVWVPSGQGGGGGMGYPQQMYEAMKYHYHQTWLPEAYLHPWRALDQYDNPWALRGLLQHERVHVLTNKGLVSFDGYPAILIRVRLPHAIEFPITNGRLYIDPKTYLIRGIRGTSCVATSPAGHDFEGPCTKSLTWRIVLTGSRTVPACHGAAWEYNWYFTDGSLLPKGYPHPRSAPCPPRGN